MSPAPQLHTAARLARAAGISKRSLARALGIAPRGTVVVLGNPAHAWHLSDLPGDVRKTIHDRAVSAGVDAETFIASDPQPWQLKGQAGEPLSLSDLARQEITKAEKLRRALARVIELRNRPEIARHELESFGLEDFKREFQYAVTARTLRALLKRTIDRDNGFENWNRLEIYLDGNPRRNHAAPPQPDSSAALEFVALHDLMAAFRSTISPSTRERESVWLWAVKHVHQRAANAEDPARVRARLVNFLSRSAPWMGKSKDALRKAIERKCARWQDKEQAENALRDGRAARRGIPTAPAIPKELIDNVTAYAAFNAGGRVSQAVRDIAAMAGELGIEQSLAAKLLMPEAASKSYVNARLREAVRHDVRLLQPCILGGLAMDNATAWIERDYSGIPSGYCYNADDVTLPVYWFVPDGQGWFTLVRGQCLLAIDFRTLRVLGFSLQPDRNYSSPVIHTLFTRVFADWGVPPVLYLERGIWKRSRLITGGPKAERVNADWDYLPLSWNETERGFGDLGVHFIHAIRARSKPVERVIGLVQDQMQGEPGYCGRDERRDKPEACRQHEADVKARRVHPSKHFYDFDQWETRLFEIFRHYNATPQQGKILAGMSPDEAQEKLQDPERSPMQFGDGCRHLLAHYRKRTIVGVNGITFRIGKRTYVYRGKETAAQIGHEVLAWFNPDDPSVLAVTDLNMRKPHSVALSGPVDALDALNPDSQKLADELALIADHQSYRKARYKTLKADFAPKFRRVVATRAVVETGAQIQQQRETIQAHRQQHQQQRRNVQRRAESIGIPASILTSPEADEGTRMMINAIREHEAKTL